MYIFEFPELFLNSECSRNKMERDESWNNSIVIAVIGKLALLCTLLLVLMFSSVY